MPRKAIVEVDEPAPRRFEYKMQEDSPRAAAQQAIGHAVLDLWPPGRHLTDSERHVHIQKHRPFMSGRVTVTVLDSTRKRIEDKRAEFQKALDSRTSDLKSKQYARAAALGKLTQTLEDFDAQTYIQKF